MFFAVITNVHDNGGKINICGGVSNPPAKGHLMPKGLAGAPKGQGLNGHKAKGTEGCQKKGQQIRPPDIGQKFGKGKGAVL